MAEVCSGYSLKEIARFFAEYCAWLLGSGSTCIRLEENVARMAKVFKVNIHTFTLPRHVEVSVSDKHGNCFITSEQVKKIPINFKINTDLSRLSWYVADKNLDLPDAIALLKHIVNVKESGHPILLTLLVSLANASFCRLFGGDLIAMVIVAIATFIGFWLKGIMLSHKVDNRLVFFICAFISSMIGASDMFFSFSSTPAIALGTSVLYLVPGIPFLNSFSDMINRHYIFAFSRFMDALILTCCLSAGLCLGMIIMHVSMF